jgi:inhibitor of cysteine peptidase
MFRKTSITIAIILMASAFAFCLNPLILLEKDNGRQITVANGTVIDIALSGNPTTGFNWDITSRYTPQLKIIAGPKFKPATNKLGSSGKITYRFKAVKAGKTQLRMLYRRSWETTAPSKTFIVNFTVK